MLSDKYNSELQELKFPQESYPGHLERLTPWFQAQEKLVPQEAISHSLTSQITFRRGPGQGNVSVKAEITHWPGLLSCTHLQSSISTSIRCTSRQYTEDGLGDPWTHLFVPLSNMATLRKSPISALHGDFFFLMCSTADGRLSLACDWQSPGFDLKNSRNAGLFCKCCKYSVILNWVGREVWFSSFLLF